jgi:hypothetical protein
MSKIKITEVKIQKFVNVSFQNGGKRRLAFDSGSAMFTI